MDCHDPRQPVKDSGSSQIQSDEAQVNYSSAEHVNYIWVRFDLIQGQHPKENAQEDDTKIKMLLFTEVYTFSVSFWCNISECVK